MRVYDKDLNLNLELYDEKDILLKYSPSLQYFCRRTREAQIYNVEI